MVIEADIEVLLQQTVGKLSTEELRRQYLEQDEFLVVSDALSPLVLGLWDQELENLKPHIHRSFIPRHKKGGSVGYETVRALAPTIDQVYQSATLLQFIREIVQAPLNECPRSDPHRCALYAYTEEGDHIGLHYDTSYYRDRRWTALIGFQDNSSSRLHCRLHTRNPRRNVEEVQLRVGRGMLVLFNGDKLHHAVTPLKPGESRFIVSMQFVTSSEMNPLMRLISNMKDSVAYFGPREVFLGRRKTPH